MSEQAVMPGESIADWEAFGRLFVGSSHPLFSQLDMDLIHISDVGVVVHATIGECFKVSPEEPNAHAGALTIILDSIFGLALFAHIQEMNPIATINLKTEYIGSPSVGLELKCNASCFAIDGKIARMRGEIREIKSGNVLATSTGAFMIGTAGPSFLSRGEGIVQ